MQEVKIAGIKRTHPLALITRRGSVFSVIPKVADRHPLAVKTQTTALQQPVLIQYDSTILSSTTYSAAARERQHRDR